MNGRAILSPAASCGVMGGHHIDALATAIVPRIAAEVVAQLKFSALNNNATMRIPGASHSVRLLSPNKGQPGRLAWLRTRRGAFPMPGKLQAARAGAISL
jgi:hypothetical protein